MSTETLAIDATLVDVLRSDATLSGQVGGRIYSDVAPQGAAFPFVVFSQQAASDIRGVGIVRWAVEALYTVKVVNEGGSYEPLAAILTRIDQLVTGLSGTSAYGQVLTAVREDTIRFTLVEDGRQYRHLGGTYRLYSQ